MPNGGMQRLHKRWDLKGNMIKFFNIYSKEETVESNVVCLLCSQAHSNCSVSNCLMNEWPDVLKFRREVWAEGTDERLISKEWGKPWIWTRVPLGSVHSGN